MQIDEEESSSTPSYRYDTRSRDKQTKGKRKHEVVEEIEEIEEIDSKRSKKRKNQREQRKGKKRDHDETGIEGEEKEWKKRLINTIDLIEDVNDAVDIYKRIKNKLDSIRSEEGGTKPEITALFPDAEIQAPKHWPSDLLP